MNVLTPCLVGMLGRRQLGDDQRPKSLPSSPAHFREKAEAMRPEDLLLFQENQRLKAELAELRAQASPSPSASPSPTSVACSEGRLRAALTSQGASVSQLRHAIASVEALLAEARRELAVKELRERRAAIEVLHAAVDKGDEAALPAVIEAAQRAGVDRDDVERAEAKLKELRSLTGEERAAKASRELETKRKKEAFLLVKKNDGPALAALLDVLAEGTRWQDWRDHAGRSLWRCAQELHAPKAQAALAPRLGLAAPVGRPIRDGAPPAGVVSERVAALESLPTGQGAAASSGRPPLIRPFVERQSSAPMPSPAPVRRFGEDDSGSQPGSPTSSPATRAISFGASPQRPAAEITEEDKLKVKAFRAVVQDDGAALTEVIELASIDVVAVWQNRAGTDLLTLAEERGSGDAYSVLAKALGIMRELKREEFEERDTVWVFVPGDVQPKRATVLEDTPEESDTILLEYWDGDDEPMRVERSRIRRMWS